MSIVALMLLIGAVVMLRSIDNLDDEPDGTAWYSSSR